MNATNNPNDFPLDTWGPDGQVVKSPYYGYLVSHSTALTFVVLFGITTLLHLAQAIYWRMWFLLPTVVLAGVGELLGWGGRLWSAYEPLNQNPYLMQIVATILAPTPYVAALFIIFSRITQKLGTEYSRLSPQWYSRIFLTADIIALVVQGAGGGIAATANTDSGSSLGGNIMLGGIIFQLIALIAFIAIATEYFIRYIQDRPVRYAKSFGRVEWDRNMKVFVAGLIFIITCILIRSVYRTAELANGWNGKIITTELWFNLFDGTMIVLAMWALNVIHPGQWMRTPQDDVVLPKDMHTMSTLNDSASRV